MAFREQNIERRRNSDRNSDRNSRFSSLFPRIWDWLSPLPPTHTLGVRDVECSRVCMCVCVYVCVWPSGAVVCAVDFQLKHCGFDPRRVRLHTSFFSFSISGWLPTAKCVCLCMSEHMWEKKERKRNSHWAKAATESRVV